MRRCDLSQGGQKRVSGGNGNVTTAAGASRRQEEQRGAEEPERVLGLYEMLRPDSGRYLRIQGFLGLNSEPLHARLL